MKTDNSKELVQRLDKSVLSVIGNVALAGFEKAHVVSNAIIELKTLLTDDYMKPIMALQGNKLGFRTDKDKTGGYDVAVVRNCLIEAVLMGIQPTGNQFNIIAGNMYPTKEGCGYLLNNYPGLKWDIVPGIPRVNPEKTGAAIEMTINWELSGAKNTKVVPIPVKMDQYTSIDAVIGKATRKARAWLLSTIMGTEITDGEVTDIPHTVVAEEIDVDELQFQYENKKSLLSAEEQARIEEIIRKKETPSFKKALEIMNRK